MAWVPLKLWNASMNVILKALKEGAQRKQKLYLIICNFKWTNKLNEIKVPLKIFTKKNCIFRYTLYCFQLFFGFSPLSEFVAILASWFYQNWVELRFTELRFVHFELFTIQKDWFKHKYCLIWPIYMEPLMSRLDRFYWIRTQN